MEWDGTRSDDGGGAGGVALDWVFTVEGGARVRVCQDGRGVMQGGRNESGWVGIGESLTAPPPCILTIELLICLPGTQSTTLQQNILTLGITSFVNASLMV